jgi:signal transduction histidine kinase
VRCRREGPHALVEVQDEGTGMPEAVRQRIFEPFFTTKPPGRGTGLGLASVRALVEQASGQLEVLSQEGVGTTFRIRFPLRVD